MKTLKKCPTKQNFKYGNVSLTPDELSMVRVGLTLLIVLRPITGVYTSKVITQEMVDATRFAPGRNDVLLMPFSDKALAEANCSNIA